MPEHFKNNNEYRPLEQEFEDDVDLSLFLLSAELEDQNIPIFMENTFIAVSLIKVLKESKIPNLNKSRILIQKLRDYAFTIYEDQNLSRRMPRIGGFEELEGQKLETIVPKLSQEISTILSSGLISGPDDQIQQAPTHDDLLFLQNILQSTSIRIPRSFLEGRYAILESHLNYIKNLPNHKIPGVNTIYFYWLREQINETKRILNNPNLVTTQNFMEYNLVSSS